MNTPYLKMSANDRAWCAIREVERALGTASSCISVVERKQFSADDREFLDAYGKVIWNALLAIAAVHNEHGK